MSPSKPTERSIIANSPPTTRVVGGWNAQSPGRGQYCTGRAADAKDYGHTEGQANERLRLFFTLEQRAALPLSEASCFVELAALE
jgi:hypothetical protein